MNSPQNIYRINESEFKMISNIRSIIQQGEGISVEFKECKNKINRDLYETVCAFLNRNGGEILLGVKDDGEVVGIEEASIIQIKKDFVTSMNNPEKITPTFYLSIDEIKIEDKTILYIYVPESSQVHRCNGKIFDRNEDGDFDITNHTNDVTNLYDRKKRTFSENDIYPFVKITDLRSDLIAKVRKMAVLQRANHPWRLMDDFELLNSAGLYSFDYVTSKEGFNLAAVLLFGQDRVISSILPYHKTDAILRRENVDRYDDRDDIRTNLLDSYDRIMAFISKHLPDKFYLENDHRINIRDAIFREVATNILIHREYANPFPAKLIIGNSEIMTENSNKPHGHGKINPNKFSPFPKNPIIAKVFKEIGLVDELGSGVRNIYKYCKNYFGSEPSLIEEDIFKIIIPINNMHGAMQATMHVTMQAKKIDELLEYCKIPKTRKEMQEFMELANRDYFRINILIPLIDSGRISLTLPEKPKSPKQKYYYNQK